MCVHDVFARRSSVAITRLSLGPVYVHQMLAYYNTLSTCTYIS